MPERQAQTHSRRKLAFTNLDQVQEDAQSLLKSGYVRLGNWDLGQCCTHLAIAMDLSIDGFPAALPPPISTINHWTFFRYRWIRSLDSLAGWQHSSSVVFKGNPSATG